MSKTLPESKVARLNRCLSEHFPLTEDLPQVVSTMDGILTLVQPFSTQFLRPGEAISGPTLMRLADVAAYLAVLGEIGLSRQAVTSSLTIHFHKKAPPGDLYAQAFVKHAGRRQFVISVEIKSGCPGELVADALVAYTRVSN